MSSVKERGGADFEVFDEQMRARVVHRFETEMGVRRALAPRGAAGVLPTGHRPQRRTGVRDGGTGAMGRSRSGVCSAPASSCRGGGDHVDHQGLHRGQDAGGRLASRWRHGTRPARTSKYRSMWRPGNWSIRNCPPRWKRPPKEPGWPVDAVPGDHRERLHRGRGPGPLGTIDEPAEDRGAPQRRRLRDRLRPRSVYLSSPLKPDNLFKIDRSFV